MKTEEIRKMTEDELKTKLFELKKEYFNLRFQHSVGQLENTAILPGIRKKIARVYTIARETNLTIT
ncbi:MAG: 50S ribosomal protein L29 [Thermodesulfobacteriota bacterium]|nr:50S ribosomal protein L29 [Thermodesulfobacteriota bacterium]